MKALVILPCVVLASVGARADGTRSLETATLASKPVSTGKSETDCNGGTLIVGARIIKKTRITIVHDCGMAHEGGVLVMEMDGGRIVASEPYQIRFHPGDGLEPVMFKEFVSDRIYPGTLIGGGPGVLQAIITRDEHHTAANRSIDSRATTMHVQACSLGVDPGCAVVGDYVCKPKGCAVPTLKNGRVRVVDGTGKVDTTTLVVEIE